MRGAGFLAIWSDVERSNLTDYRHWLTREHTTERVTTEGFLANRVFRAVRADIERFFILYELETPEVLDGPAYLARLNAPSPWSQRIMPQLGNFIRGGGVVTARAGRGEGATIVALRLERLPEKPQRLADDIAALDGIAAVQIGATDIARTSVPTIEKGMRKDEGVFAGLLLIEALDEASLRAAVRRAAEMAPDVLGDVGDPEIYQGIFALDKRIAWIRVMPSFSLAALTVLELAPPALIDVAAACGYRACRYQAVAGDARRRRLSADGRRAGLKETIARLDATGVTVADLEVVALRPETEIAGFSAFFETGARLGAKHILVAAYDPVLERFADRFAAFCEAAAPFGLSADLEFMPWTAAPDLATARRIVEKVGKANAGVLVDALHFDRSGSSIGDIAQNSLGPVALLAIMRRPGRAAGDDGSHDAGGPHRADVSGRGRHRPRGAGARDAGGYRDQP